MKNLKIIFLFSLLFFCLNANSQWIRLNGPEGCYPTSLIQFSGKILCGTPQGIYISTDEGATWSDYTNFPTRDINSMVNFSDTIVILFHSGFIESTYYDSLFSSTSFDGGNTWSVPYFISEVYYADLHAYGNKLMANVAEGLFISPDYGISWTKIQIPFGQYYSNAIFFDSIYIFGTSDINFTQTFNYWGFGASPLFHRFDSLNTIRGITAIDTVFFGYQMNTASYFDIIRSTNLTQTWQPVRTVNQSSSFQLFAFDDSLYYRDNFNYYVSGDFGNTWNTTPRPHKLDYQSIIPISNGDEICRNGTLVHYVTSADSSFLSQSGIRGSNISEIASNDSAIFVIADQGRISKSRDAGLTWDTLGPYAVNKMLVFGDTIFCNSFYPMRSFDGGQSWTILNNPPQPMFSTLVKAGNRIYGSWQDTYYTDDFGDHWTQIPSTFLQNSCIGWTSLGTGNLAQLGNNLYSIDYDGVVGRFDFIGSDWTEVFCITIQSGSYDSPLIQTIDNFLVITYESKMYTSYDGMSWHLAHLNGIPTGISGSKICPQSLLGVNGELYGVCGTFGIFHSYNNGDDWQPLTPTNPFLANCLAVFNHQLFAGSRYQGVWASGITVNVNNNPKNNNNINNNIFIFPNPASDYFKIDLSSNLNVNRIFILDQFGRKIMELQITKNIEEINTSQLPKGIYYGQLLNENEIVSNFKIIVLR